MCVRMLLRLYSGARFRKRAAKGLRVHAHPQTSRCVEDKGPGHASAQTLRPVSPLCSMRLLFDVVPARRHARARACMRDLTSHISRRSARCLLTDADDYEPPEPTVPPPIAPASPPPIRPSLVSPPGSGSPALTQAERNDAPPADGPENLLRLQRFYSAVNPHKLPGE